MTQSQHAIIVRFEYGLPNLQPLHALADQLRQAVINVGEYDGHEIATDLSHGFLYLYGTDADRLFAVIRPVLSTAAFMDGATARLRFGGPDEDAREESVTVRAST